MDDENWKKPPPLRPKREYTLGGIALLLSGFLAVAWAGIALPNANKVAVLVAIAAIFAAGYFIGRADESTRRTRE